MNVQRGVDAYLAAHQSWTAQDEPEWFGAPEAGVHPHENLLSLLSTPARAGGIRIAGHRDGTRRRADGDLHQGREPVRQPFCTLEVLAADRPSAAATRDEIGRLIRAHDVFRGQVLSFTESEHHGNELVSLLPRPAVTAQDVVLPDGVLESIEQHIIGVAD